MPSAHHRALRYIPRLLLLALKQLSKWAPLLSVRRAASSDATSQNKQCDMDGPTHRLLQVTEAPESQEKNNFIGAEDLGVASLSV